MNGTSARTLILPGFLAAAVTAVGRVVGLAVVLAVPLGAAAGVATGAEDASGAQSPGVVVAAGPGVVDATGDAGDEGSADATVAIDGDGADDGSEGDGDAARTNEPGAALGMTLAASDTHGAVMVATDAAGSGELAPVVMEGTATRSAAMATVHQRTALGPGA